MSESKALAVLDTEGLTEEELALLDDVYEQSLEEDRQGVNLKATTIDVTEHGFVMPPDKDHSEEWITKTITAIIVKKQAVRSYYAPNREDDEDKVPDCYSSNSVKPSLMVENPVASYCKECPKNAWGSAVDDNGNAGKGKACQEKRKLFLLVEGNSMPMLLYISPTSIKNFDAFVTNLITSKIPLLAQPVKLSVRKQTRGEFVWGMVEFERGGSLVAPKELIDLKRLQDRISDEVDERVETHDEDNIPF